MVLLAAVHTQNGLQAHTHTTTDDAYNPPQQAIPTCHKTLSRCILLYAAAIRVLRALLSILRALLSSLIDLHRVYRAVSKWAVIDHLQQLRPHMALRFIQHGMG